uniref:TIR domain-containing protein n=1 Tax=Podarcis muralis TaxID=64176 RepID=A0A670K4F9_PODMU
MVRGDSGKERERESMCYNAFHSLEDLEVLDLSWNQLVSVESSMLSSLRNLRELFLGHNSIATLHPSSLISQVALQELHLPNNNLSSLQEVATATQGLANLTFLDLGSNQISTPCMGSSWIVFPSLRNLSLNSNGISRLDLSNCSFPNLQQLNLTHNNMSQVEAGSFRATPVLVELSFNMNPLDISQLINATLPNLTMLHLSSMNPPLNESMSAYLKNGVFETFQGLEFLSLEKCKRSFFGMEALRTLILQGCQITAVTRNTFHYARKMEFLDLRDNSIKLIKPRAFLLKHMGTLLLSGNKILTLSRGVFTPLKKLEILDISHNHLFTYNKYDYPSPFAGLRSLRKLDLSFQSPRLPICPPDKVLQGLGNLQYLSLKGNPSLLFLNISFDLPEQIFSGLTSLEQLSLSKNDLRNISKKTLRGLSSLKYLDVSGNPLTCSCDNAWFQNWSVSEPNIQVSLLGSYHCFGPGTTDRLFAYEDFSFCFETRGIYFFIATTVITLCFLFTVLVYAKFGWTLRHGYYLLRGWGFKRLRQKGQEYQYDAYISCCSQDHEWVVNNVLEKLEVQGEPSLRLCFGPRDFAPGEYYIDNVQNGISQSRKTLCVVSDNYLESEWCSLEIQLACSKIYYQREDPLVVVFMEEIPNYRNAGEGYCLCALACGLPICSWCGNVVGTRRGYIDLTVSFLTHTCESAAEQHSPIYSRKLVGRFV